MQEWEFHLMIELGDQKQQRISKEVLSLDVSYHCNKTNLQKSYST